MIGVSIAINYINFSKPNYTLFEFKTPKIVMTYVRVSNTKQSHAERQHA